MILNRIRPEIDPILRKNQNGFRKNRSTLGQILTIRRILEGIKSKNLPLTLLFIDFSKAFDSIKRNKMEQILQIYGIPTETIEAIMMLYRNTRSMVRSPDGDTAFFEITTGVMQGDTLAPFLCILCLDYILKTSVDINAELGFTLTERRSRRYPATHITDIDYADDIAITTNDMKSANTLLHQIEVTSNEIGLSINTEKTQYMKLNQNSDSDDITINSINGKIIAKEEHFNYLGSCIGSTEKNIQIRIAKALSALNSMQEIWKSKMPDKLKRIFFRAAVESALEYGAISWTLTAKLEGKIDGAYTRMLRAALNK